MLSSVAKAWVSLRRTWLQYHKDVEKARYLCDLAKVLSCGCKSHVIFATWAKCYQAARSCYFWQFEDSVLDKTFFTFSRCNTCISHAAALVSALSRAVYYYGRPKVSPYCSFSLNKVYSSSSLHWTQWTEWLVWWGDDVRHCPLISFPEERKPEAFIHVHSLCAVVFRSSARILRSFSKYKDQRVYDRPVIDIR